MNTEERQQVELAMQIMHQAAQQNDVEAIKQAIDQVDKASQVFAERRMDKSINTALAGQSVTDI